MKKPNILFISYAFYPNIGGIEVNSEILTTSFHQLGYPIRVITSVEEKGEKLFPFPVLRNPNLFELIRQHKWADVVFENSPSLRLSWPRLLFGAQSVIAIRGRISREDGSFNFQDKLKIRSMHRAQGVIAVSSAMRDTFFPKATVIGNPYRSEIFKNLNQNRPPLTFVFLGRLVSEKGVHIALESLYQISSILPLEHSKPSFRIIGDGPELEKLQKLVEAKGLKGQVSFEGRQEGTELVRILNSCRYILVPSANEGFGNVAIEGMACGCLPIVSDCGGLPDAVGQAGVLFQTYSAEALTQAILRLINNPKLEADYRSKMEDHLEQHQPERVAERYLSVINNAYKKKAKLLP